MKKSKLRPCVYTYQGGNTVKALFHRWITESARVSAGILNTTYGLIELSDGTVFKVFPENIRFSDMEKQKLQVVDFNFTESDTIEDSVETGLLSVFSKKYALNITITRGSNRMGMIIWFINLATNKKCNYIIHEAYYEIKSIGDIERDIVTQVAKHFHLDLTALKEEYEND